MKRNGWGLRAELLFILMFLMCLVIAVIGLNRMGLIGEKGIINNSKTEINTKETYILMEQELTTASKEYVNKYYGGENIKDYIVVRYSSLYYNGYIDKLTNNSNRECSGYVIVNNIDSVLIYNSYLKCPGYRTSGYESGKDW